MFYPHRANILANREEPSNLDLKSATDFVMARNSAVAARVIAKAILQPKKITKRVEKKISNAWQLQQGKQDVTPFMIIWNRWRKFYFELPPIAVKTVAQLTQIENILTMAREENLDLSLLIACTHKAFVWRKVNPNFSEVIYAGKDHLGRFREEVLIDIDKAAYQVGAIR